ncbi:ubiquinone anaerobic biosynthesis accessory factor UbiT [Bartonella sp. HY761]|uniref:ubiquinone anaerobic biosynthesis accessory factor UbiT n=1 Tax=Bartonella sp. HY761 TaxID=2979330 RepID=UPI0022026A37|nr:SCP2 sterol-binding domain-containing protein [Bartonella sp. HY761]UXN07124.1 SCP2 sterol-binding domain-containing protein [Bartonella sp. HY761]
MQLAPPLKNAISHLPLPLLSLPARLAFSQILLVHPKLFDRLGEHASKNFAFILTDMPLVFVVNPQQKSIKLFKDRKDIKADAEVEGPLGLLLALAEGRLDADALFFSRDVMITGDMEAMLALRNALDDNEIDLPHDLSLLSGPLAPITEKVAKHLRRHFLKEEPKQWN